MLDTFQPGEGSLILQWNIFLPFHSVHGVLHVRILEWAAISFSSEPHFVRTLHYDQTILSTTNEEYMMTLEPKLDFG